jgi:hypothetical protein
MRALQPYDGAHKLLQTIPGIDELAAALIPEQHTSGKRRGTSQEARPLEHPYKNQSLWVCFLSA